MAHEITSSDNVILVKEAAWHGLGIVVSDCPTPTDSLRRIKGDWTVERQPIYRQLPQTTLMAPSFVEIPTHFMNVRSDTGEELGLVGKDWQCWQNLEVAEFAERLAKDSDIVRIETAGTIRGGRKIWFLLRGESFSVRRQEDAIVPYILVSNGHDGLTGLRCTPTTIRVVCSNTLHMVIPDANNPRKLRECGYSCTHRGDLKGKLDEARAALGLYEHALTDTITMYDALAGKQVGQAAVDQFLTEVYAKAIDNFPLNPTNDEQAKRRDKAVTFISRCVANFEDQSVRYGANAWTLLNSFTETSQAGHRSASAAASAKLFGVDATRGTKALQLAMGLAV